MSEIESSWRRVGGEIQMPGLKLSTSRPEAGRRCCPPRWRQTIVFWVAGVSGGIKPALPGDKLIGSHDANPVHALLGGDVVGHVGA